MIQNCGKMTSGGYRSNRACLWDTRFVATSGPRPALKTRTGELLKHDGLRTVDFWCQGEELRVDFTVVDVKRPILRVSRLMDRGIETFNGATVELTRRSGLFFSAVSNRCSDVAGTCGRRKLLISHLLTRRRSVN